MPIRFLGEVFASLVRESCCSMLEMPTASFSKTRYQNRCLHNIHKHKCMERGAHVFTFGNHFSFDNQEKQAYN